MCVAEQANKRHEEYINDLKQDHRRREKEMEFTIQQLKEQLNKTEKTHADMMGVKIQTITALEKNKKELEDEISRTKEENEQLRKEMKARDLRNQKLFTEAEKRYTEDIESLQTEQNMRKQADLQKQQKLEQANACLGEEISLLKSKVHFISQELSYQTKPSNF